jgi:hypothetical protein
LLRIVLISTIDLDAKALFKEEDVQNPLASHTPLTCKGVAKLAAIHSVENPRKFTFCRRRIPSQALGEFLNAAARSLQPNRRR